VQRKFSLVALLGVSSQLPLWLPPPFADSGNEMTADLKRIATLIAAEIVARPEQAAAAIGLLDKGATVPFIARYRKEATGGLDDAQLRLLAERLVYRRELEARREAIIKSISGQGKLTEELAAKIAAVDSKAELEDLYLPYKPKRRTRADITRERGLGPLAESILFDRSVVPNDLAQSYLSAAVADAKSALEGARDILAESFAGNAEVVGRLRRSWPGRAAIWRKRSLRPNRNGTRRVAALFSQAALQGAFVLAKAKGGPKVAADCLDHLKCYFEGLLPLRERSDAK